MKNIIFILSKLKKDTFFSLLYFVIILIITALFETFSVSSISPLLQELSNSNLVNNQSALEQFLANNFLQNFDVISLKLFIFIIAVILAGLTRLYTLWVTTRITAKICHEIALDIYERNIQQSYEYHIKRSSDYLINVCTREMERVSESIGGIFNIITSITISVSLIITIYKINGNIIWIIISIFLLVYLVYYLFSINFLKKYGRNITRTGKKQINILQETSFGFLDLILYGLQAKYLKKYYSNEKLLRETYSNIVFINLSPKFIIEPIVIVSCLLISFLYTKRLNIGYETFIPTLGVFAIGGQKLLPAINSIYSSYSAIKANNSAFNSIIDNYKNRFIPKLKFDKKFRKFEFISTLEIKNLTYSFNSKNIILDNINLKIYKGEKVGFIGETGCGKSTLLKLMMGILEIHEGEILIDNNLLLPSKISKVNPELWYKSIAHVPQEIFLMDATIMENITFKSELSKDDLKKLNKIIKIVNLELFINELNDGIYTSVGERGIKLSGGQKQRIGIARALFKTKEIIFLDEATSALDTKTEKIIIKNISDNYPELTIIAVAHRITTLKKYDKILEVKEGKVRKIDPTKIFN